MHQHFFNYFEIKPENITIPNGTDILEYLNQYYVDYENKISKARGLDFQLLDIGFSSHVGFNEPNSHINSSSRIITLDSITKVDASSDFNCIYNVPKRELNQKFFKYIRFQYNVIKLLTNIFTFV